MADIIYYVNEQLGTVVARMPNFEEDMYQEIDNFCRIKFINKNAHVSFGFSMYFYETVHKLLHGRYEPSLKSLIGKAKCNFEAGETFDVEKGKELAKQRLMEKVFKLRYHVFHEAYKMMFEDFCMPFVIKKGQYLDHLAEYENNLLMMESEY